MAFLPVQSLLGTALTGTFQTIRSYTGRIRQIVITSDCNAAIELSFDGGVTSHVRLPSSTSIVLDGVNIQEAIKVKHGGSAPTSGHVAVTGDLMD